MNGLEILKQKWCLLNTERLTAIKCQEDAEKLVKYYIDKQEGFQEEMDSLMKEIKKLKE